MAAGDAMLKGIYVDDDDLGEQSGSGDGSYLSDTSTTPDRFLTTVPETAPGVDALLDDETNLYLYILAAAVAAIVFIFVIVILIVSIRRQAKDKKKILQCDKATLQEVKVHHAVTSCTKNQYGQATQQANLADARRQAKEDQGDKPAPHHSMMAATTTRPHMS